MRNAVVAGAVLTVLGLGMWLAALAKATGGKESSARLSDLGSALLSGAVVAFAIFFLERQSEKRAAMQAVLLTVGLASDLKNANLSGLELDRAFFSHKNLTDADLSKTKLRQASFLHATLIGTKFIGADLSSAIFSFATLTSASFAGANLTNAIFTDAQGVDAADFNSAYFEDKPPTKKAPVFDEALPAGICARSRLGR